MEEFLIYFLKVIALQSILFVFYWLISRKTTGFHFNRYFLLSALILPFLIPFLTIPINLFGKELSGESIFDPWYFIEQSLPRVVIKDDPASSSGSAWWINVIVVVYLIISIPSAFKLVYDYYKIIHLSKTSRKKEFTPLGYRLLYVPTKILSFSFLNRIFLSDLFPIKQSEKNTIVTHEEYHLTQKHSIDIILAEVIRIICWFNPVILLIQKNLKETHEYLADRYTIRTYGKNEYASLLKSFKWQEINMMLGSGYSSSSIKKRLEMMEHSHKKSPIFQGVLLSIIALATAFLFACEDKLDSFETKESTFQYEFSQADLEREIAERLTQLKNAPQDLIDAYISEQRKHPEYLYMAAVNWVTEKQKESFNLEKIKSSTFIRGSNFELEFSRMLTNEETITYFKPDDMEMFGIVSSYAIIRKVDRLKYMEYKYKSNTDDNNIHDDFDKMAQFKGGMDALVKHLKANLKYPEQAKENGIEDKLTMRFVVSKHGGLVYLNVDQPPSTEDEEISLEFQIAAFQALRSTEGLWEPAEKDGKFVMSKMTLPIEFKLGKK